MRSCGSGEVGGQFQSRAGAGLNQGRPFDDQSYAGRIIKLFVLACPGRYSLNIGCRCEGFKIIEKSKNDIQVAQHVFQGALAFGQLAPVPIG